MDRKIYSFVVVIYLNGLDPSFIISTILNNKVTALNVMSNSEWIDPSPVGEHVLLFIRPDKEWIYADNEFEKF